MSSEVHLVVCCHGLWGEPIHLNPLARSLAKAYNGEMSPRSASATGGAVSHPLRSSAAPTPDADEDDAEEGNILAANGGSTSSGSHPKLVVLNTASNAGSHTYDGIDWCAERVVVEIHDEIRRLAQDPKGKRIVVSFSMVGYSLGGLVARYTIGLLYSRNFFDKIRPVNFTTFATPHLGAAIDRGGFSKFAAFVGARSLGRTGRQLYYLDNGWSASDKANAKDQPKAHLMEALSDPTSSFMRALHNFEHVDFYANAVSDWVVPIRSGALMEADPWKGWPQGGELDLEGQGIQVERLEGYPALVTALRIPSQPPKPKSLPRRIIRKIIPRSWPWILNPYRNPWKFPINWLVVIFSPVLLPVMLSLVVYKLQSGTRESNKRVKDLQKDWLKRGAASSSSSEGLKNQSLVYGEEHERNRINEVLNITIQGVVEDNVDLSSSSKSSHTDSNNATATAPSSSPPRQTTTPLALDLTPESRDYIAKKEVPLTTTQRTISANLNAVPGLRKHLVFFENVMNSHAIIVCRTPSIEVHQKGKIVIKHFVDHFTI